MFQSLYDCLHTIPGLIGEPSGGIDPSGRWWVRFSISLEHPLSRLALLRLAEAVNQMCVRDRVPALFYPVALESPLPNCLSWAFEAKNFAFRPAALAAGFHSRPQPA